MNPCLNLEVKTPLKPLEDIERSLTKDLSKTTQNLLKAN